MKMTQCTVYKNHFYDADKYSTCPHCAKINGNDKDERKGFFSRKKQQEQTAAPVYDDDRTVMLTNVLEPMDTDDEPQSQPSVAEQIDHVALTGNIEDIKTVALYGFEDEDVFPVVGWLVAVSGKEKGRSFELKSGKNSIGRNGGGTTVDISLDSDHTISRGTQAVLIYEPVKRQFLLQAANGSSLVYLNDELLMNYNSISAYDSLTIGETKMVFIPFCGEKFSWEENE